jgi:hypothetical protein
MPSILCKCRNRLDYGEIPNPIEWRMISDVAFDGFSGLVDADDVYQKNPWSSALCEMSKTVGLLGWI